MRENTKKILVCFLVVLILGLLPEVVLAFSFRIYGGGLNHDENHNYTQIGFDISFYEGKYLHLFSGGEYTSYLLSTTSLYPSLLKFKYDSIGASLGLRLIAITKGRLKPYLSVQGIAMHVIDNKIIKNTSNMIIDGISDVPSLNYDARLGVEIIRKSKEYTLGIEAIYMGQTRIGVDSPSGPRGIHLDGIFGINLALRFF